MPGENDLSERELEILKLLSTGASNKEIAQQLVISPNTVKVHLRNIFSKIDVVSRTEATLYAIKIGLIRPEGAVLQGSEMPAPEPVIQPVPWYQRAEMVIGLSAALLIFVAVLVYVFVNQNNLDQNNVNEVTSTLNRWTALAPLPEGRSGMAIERYKSSIYLISGLSPDALTGSVLAYQVNNNSWISRAPKPTPVTDAQATLIGERIYVPGGAGSDGVVTDVLEIYDPRLDAWTTGANLPGPASQYALASFEGRLYLFGGWDGSAYLDSVWTYDPGADEWQLLQPMPGPLGGAAAVMAGGKIFLIGGTNGQQALTTVRAYYPNREISGETAWEDRPDLPEARSQLQGTSLTDTVYISGGYGQDQQPFSSVLRFNESADTWEVVNEPAGEISPDAAMIGYDTRLHLFGGELNNVPSTTHQAYQAVYTVRLPAVSN